jgi:hypothetical protein
MQVKPDIESLAIGESGGSGWIWLIWWIGLFGGNRGRPAGSAKLELRFVDVQRLDAMVKRGWWNSELRRSS